jgi:predicted Fe-Mo cluster-binding NifX family protein
MVRIAFATDSDKGLEARIADRFGRALYFVIVDAENRDIKNVKTIKNPGYEAHGGAAVKAAEALIKENVNIVVGPNFGPNARAVMSELGMKPVMAQPGKTVREVLATIEY